MKFLLGAALFLVLLYIVASSAITSIESIASEPAEGGVLRGPGYSPFEVTFREQYLCYAFDRAEWRMSGHDTGDDCRGPFIDSASLCREMAAVGATRVTLHWEGRVLECG